MSHNEKKKWSKVTVLEIAQMIELVDNVVQTVLIIVFYVFKKLVERLSMLSKDIKT